MVLENSQVTKKKTESTQIINTREGKEDVAVDCTEIKRIIRNYYNKLENQEKWVHLDTCNLLKLIPDGEESLNRLKTEMEIESVTKSLPTRKAHDQMALLLDSTKHCKKNYFQFSNYSKHPKERESSQNSLNGANITLIPKSKTQQREL